MGSREGVWLWAGEGPEGLGKRCSSEYMTTWAARAPGRLVGGNLSCACGRKEGCRCPRGSESGEGQL